MKLILSVLLLSCIVSIAKAQTFDSSCVQNHNAPPFSLYYWPPDSSVNVYFKKGMFTAEQREQLLDAMEHWNSSSEVTGAGVKLSYKGETDDLMNCPSCLTITRREVFKNDRKHYAFFNPLSRDANGLLISAWIDFDFATTKAQALRGFMAHELGHGMGLWDCTTCKKRQTIMNSFPGINSDNGLTAPSNCDLEIVRRLYRLQRQMRETETAALHR